MRDSNRLIEEIVALCRIPSARRRHDLGRELRTHVEDFEETARLAGHSDEEVQRMVLASFGDARPIGNNFAWVYRHDRALFQLSSFGICALGVGCVISAVILAIQSVAALGIGERVETVLASRHTIIEVLDILATAVAYVGFLSLENLFERYRFSKALSLLSLTFVIIAGGCFLAGIRAPYVFFGFGGAVFLRAVQRFVNSPTARWLAVPVCFALLPVVLFWMQPKAYPYFAAATVASWLIMGTCYQWMTVLAARLDRELSTRLQQF